MPSLADRTEIVGFFSYSREDDEDSGGALSALRDRIQRVLGSQLGRSKSEIQLWQDKEAIPYGTLWEQKIAEAIGQSVFFLPIVTPRAVRSKHCQFEFETFLAREQQFERANLVFPILHIDILGLHNKAAYGADPVLSIVQKRQYANWTHLRNASIQDRDYREAIDKFCVQIAAALSREAPDDAEVARRRQAKADAAREREALARQYREEQETELRQAAEARRQADEAARIPPAPAVLGVQTRPRGLQIRLGAAAVALGMIGGALWLAGGGSGTRTAGLPKPAEQVSTASPPPAAAVRPLPLPATATPPAVPAQSLAAAKIIRDCPYCPELVLIPAGRFDMGIPLEESKREDTESNDSDARPVRKDVRIGQPFYLGKYHVTRGEYAAFATAANRKIESPFFEQTDMHPVVDVSWDDAQAYVVWLSHQTGKTYRLPSEAEWEYAARAGTSTARYWGDSVDQQCRFANGRDQSNQPGGKLPDVAPCDDGFKYTSPVGSFRPNAFGLYDMLGNAWQWVQDCYGDNYNTILAAGSAIESQSCSFRVLRGGSWNYFPRNLRAGHRLRIGPANRNYDFGLRVARTLTP